MRHILLSIAIISTFLFCEGQAQNIDFSKSVILHFSHDSDPAAFWISYFMIGSFGGYGSFIQTKAKTWDYEIPVSDEGKPATKMKLIISGPKYKTRVYDFAEDKQWPSVIDIKPEERSTLPFGGKASLPFGADIEGLRLKVSFLESWHCEYFGLIDCLIEGHHITYVGLDGDGRFKVDLPDFAGDSDIAAFGDKGTFQFSIEDGKTGKFLYNLRPENGLKGSGRTRVAASYPVERVYIVEPRN